MPKRYDAGEVITAMVTPFDKNGQIDYAKVEELANLLLIVHIFIIYFGCLLYNFSWSGQLSLGSLERHGPLII